MPKKKLSKKYKGGANSGDIHLNEIKKLLEERKLSGSNQEINNAILSYRVLLYRFTSSMNNFFDCKFSAFSVIERLNIL